MTGKDIRIRANGGGEFNRLTPFSVITWARGKCN